jgi:hypothetical protein
VRLPHPPDAAAAAARRAWHLSTPVRRGRVSPLHHDDLCDALCLRAFAQRLLCSQRRRSTSLLAMLRLQRPAAPEGGGPATAAGTL